MDQFATLEPVKLYSSTFLGRSSSISTTTNSANKKKPGPLIGRLPSDLHLLVLAHLPVPDIPSYSRCCRATAAFVRDEKNWKSRWKSLGVGSGDESESDDEDSSGSGRSVKTVLDMLDRKASEKAAGLRAAAPPMIPVEDEFGDFAAAEDIFASPGMGKEDEMGDFVGAFQDSRHYMPNSPRFPASVSSYGYGGAPPVPSKVPEKETYRSKYIHAHNLLKPLTRLLSSPPHIVLADLAAYIHTSEAPSSPTLQSPSLVSTQTSTLWMEALTLKLLFSFLSPAVQPLQESANLLLSLRTAMDRFDSNLLAAFDVADGKGDEEGMREAAEASWVIQDREGGTGEGGDWEMGKVWAEKREIFYQQEKWRALDNFTSEKELDFAAMDAFMDDILAAIHDHGARAVRVFPPKSQVILLFSERLANEVISDYIQTLLTHAREISISTYLRSTAASFKVAWKMVDAIMEVVKLKESKKSKVVKGKEGSKGKGAKKEVVGRIRAEDVIYQMFETNMDEYLDEEVEAVKSALDAICKGWDQEDSSSPTTPSHSRRFISAPSQSESVNQIQAQIHQNPATLKRNVLASFTSILLLPVTIVPRTVTVVGGAVGGALVAGGGAAVQGIAMLNPQRWGSGASGGSGNTARVSATGWGGKGANGTGSWGNEAAKNGYSKSLEGGALFEIEDEDEDDGDVGMGVGKGNFKENGTNGGEKSIAMGIGMSPSPWGDHDGANSLTVSQLELTSPTPLMGGSSPLPSPAPLTVSTRATSETSQSTPSSLPNHKLNSNSISNFSPDNSAQQLDLLLSLDVALEIIHADRESLKRVETFTGYPGHYGHRVRDTIEEIFVLALGALGERHVVRGFMRATERMKAYKPSEHSATTSVAPLVQFFELVHIGDTIQSIMQVYFDKELAHHIDKTDFLNTVVREKKRFENALDDSVAAGLNAGTEVLMNQVEYIILTLTKPREYYPPEDAPLELGPTKGCTEAIKCLENHCKLLKGSTSKEVLEVFYQEVGLRLIGILQKHIKRQIISLSGGFQVIADLNAYGAFIASLKIPAITSDFSHLKMLGHVYVVEDAKDLAQIVKDVARYGGAYRPEDVYEFIQRRSDWKKIEKTVDKTMYNLSFKEDCTIC